MADFSGSPRLALGHVYATRIHATIISAFSFRSQCIAKYSTLCPAISTVGSEAPSILQAESRFVGLKIWSLLAAREHYGTGQTASVICSVRQPVHFTRAGVTSPKNRASCAASGEFCLRS
nr:hypothetical protein CFP56_62182 [Quercus suber]